MAGSAGVGYLVQNGAMSTTAPIAGITTSATLFTLVQISPYQQPIWIREWGISFNGSALATPFQCELVETGTVGATVTAFATADIMPYDDANDPAQSGTTTTSIPLAISTTLSGYTSSGEGSATTNRVFDGQWVEPIGGYWKQFPLGDRPKIKPGNVVRIRVHGDGATKATCYIRFEC
jgi:hypothetical protein